MATLINRASPQQRRIYRIVRGAVKNAAHAHPGMKPDAIADSIAKRATGTLTAQWPEVLAAKPSDRAVKVLARPHRSMRSAGSPTTRRALHSVRKEVGKLAGHARKNGMPARERALVEALRIIGAALDAAGPQAKEGDG